MAANIEWVDVDRDKVALQVAETDRHRQRPVQWALKALGVATLVVVGLPLLMLLPLAGSSDLPQYLREEVPTMIGLVAGGAVLVVGSLVWSIWSKSARDVDARVRSIQRSWHSLTKPGWSRRSVLQGLAMALGVGLPLGTLMAVEAMPEDLPFGNRAMAVAVFCGMSLLWAVPVAFFLRWQLIRELRKVVRTPD